MNSPQAGIFALGTSSHAYLEFDAVGQSFGPKLVDAISALREPRTTIGGVNLVVGFRPNCGVGSLPITLLRAYTDLIPASWEQTGS